MPADHPLRPMRQTVDDIALRHVARVRPAVCEGGRASIAPERLLRALLLQVFYSIRSERLLMEQLEYNLLFRWFVGLEMDEPSVERNGVQQEPRSAAAGRTWRRSFFAAVREQAQRSCCRTSTSRWTAR